MVIPQRYQLHKGAMLCRVVLIMVLAVLSARPALSVDNEPDGFGKVRLGMSLEDVKRIFPNMTVVGTPTPESAALFVPYRVEKQSVYGLKPCEVTLFFDPERLYQITFNCGERLEVIDILRKRFGDPTQIVPNNAYWQRERTAISLNTKSRQFAFIDRHLNDGVQQKLYKYVIAHQQGAAATPAEGAPTPPATPQ